MHTESTIFAAMASPRRREILRLTWAEERGAGDIRRTMPDVSWGAVSLQLKALVDAGLLNARVEGRRRYYRADRVRLAPVADMLERMWTDALWTLKLAAELEESRRGPASAKASAGKPGSAKASAGKPGSAKASAGKPRHRRTRATEEPQS